MTPLALCATAIAVSITVHAAEQKAAATSSPAVRFTLAATGLPDDGLWKGTPVVGDFNKDGHLDIASQLRLGRGPAVWLGDGKGNWTPVKDALKFPNERASCGGGLQAVDVNQDGAVDFVVADHCEGLFVFLGDGQGAWTLVVDGMNPASAKSPEYAESDMNPYSGAEAVAVGDVNEDKYLDIVASGSDQAGFAVYLGDGSGKNWKEVIDEDGLPSQQDPGSAVQDQGGWANELILRDINKDGHLDIIASYFMGPRVWKGDGKAKWENVSQGLPSPPVGGLFHRVDVADVNEDGRFDIAVANHVNGPDVYIQQADGSWQAGPDAMPAMRGGAQSIVLGDFDGDKHVDLVVGGSLTTGIGLSYGVFLLKGDGKGNFTQVPAGLPEKDQEITWGLAVADVNTDKRLDLIVTLGGAGMKKPKPPATKENAPDVPPAPPKLPNVQVWLNTK